MAKQFKDLKVSTMTVVTYCNVHFNLRTVFENLPILEKVDVPLTKKKKQPDLKKLVVPLGSIVSLRIGNEFRGIQTKVKKAPRKEGSSYFLNQVTAIVSVGDKNLNTMIFNNKMKIVGNKNTRQAMQAVFILWKRIEKIPNSYSMIDEHPPRFVFDTVMTNVDFKLGFKIDRKKLNNLMNNDTNTDMIHLSRFETTENTNVNIKMMSTRPEGFKYVCIELAPNSKPKTLRFEDNPYMDKKSAAKKKAKYTTFLVFRSSKVIESGRYTECMRDSYDYFIDLVMRNREMIEEKITDNTEKYIHTTSDGPIKIRKEILDMLKPADKDKVRAAVHKNHTLEKK